MAHIEMTLPAADGLQLYAQAWEPEIPSRADVYLVHGMGDHTNRYQHVAKVLNDNGYSLFAVDLRGHGKSEGQRGHTPSEDAYLNDIDCLIQAARQRHPGKPGFLYGHSMGGLLVLFYTLRRRPDLCGVIATSPALSSPLTQQKVKVIMSKSIAPVLPTVSMTTGLETEHISRDPQTLQHYRSDPLVHDRATLAMAASLLRAIDWTWKHAAEFSTPLLLAHGTADQITYAQGSQDFAALVKGPVTLKLWDGLKHETHNEPERQQVLAYMVEWMNQQMITPVERLQAS